MRKILLVSPHFDDAVLSAGQFMADRPDAEVVTVFGGFPKDAETKVTPYDKKCGFENALDAVAERQRENDAALALLEATAIDLDFPDEQYDEEIDLKRLVVTLQDIIDNGDYEFVMGPLGLGHPDHILVSDVLVELKINVPLYLWEDLPLRVVEPELVWSRLDDLGIYSQSPKLKPSVTHANMAKKIRSMLCYKSQINTGILDPYLMYVPERFWQFK